MQQRSLEMPDAFAAAAGACKPLKFYDLHHFLGNDETTGSSQRQDMTRGALEELKDVCWLRQTVSNGFHKYVRIKSPEAEALIDTFAEKSRNAIS